MIVMDHLYGAFEVEEKFEALLLTPEVQRLREIRLINITSPSLPSLSDARRFGHILGVFYLAKHMVDRLGLSLSRAEIDALKAAALIHDIGTAPFGHLFEYLLEATGGWHHEDFVEQILKGRAHDRAAINLQIYYGQFTVLANVLRKAGIEADLVWSIIRGEHAKLGPLLAGSIDIDNMDNVVRMAACLGLRPDLTLPVQLVEAMAETPKDGLLVFDPSAVPLLESWLELRERVYHVLAFDEVSLGGQAMLTDCILHARSEGLIDQNDWFLTDESLVRKLWAINPIREKMKRFILGDVYKPVFLGWYARPKGDVDYRHPDNRRLLEAELSQRGDAAGSGQDDRSTGIACSTYVFYDRGTFSKRLRFFVQTGSDTELRELGWQSESTIIAVFAKSASVSGAEARRHARTVTEKLDRVYGFRSTDLKLIPGKEGVYYLRQARLPI